MIDTILGKVIEVAGTVASTIVVAGLGVGFNYLRHKIKDSRYEKYLWVLEDLTKSTVLEAMQVCVKDLKENASDGKLTPGEAEEIKHDVIQKVKSHLPYHMTKFFEQVNVDLDFLIQTYLEKWVYRENNSEVIE